MNKSKSYPASLHNAEFNLKKSNSFDTLNLDEFYFEEFFEGDGELGLVFAKHKNDIIIKNILPNSVASETYGLYKSMILINIDNRDILDSSLETINKKIRKKNATDPPFCKWFFRNKKFFEFIHNLKNIRTVITSQPIIHQFQLCTCHFIITN